MSQRAIVIGLEVHVQLKTQSKLFSSSPTVFGATPNSQANAVDLGLPGTLPVLNHNAVKMATLFALATGGSINKRNVFARKNYFYPDLPKGYQITQHQHPICLGGYVRIKQENTVRELRIHHAHLEEDAGKSIHDRYEGESVVDFNRAGQPLLEVVSMPDMFSVSEALAYLKALHQLVVYLGICDGNMQEGSFRCDANISLRPNEQATFGTRVEIKNLNSFRFIERALNYEVKRQNALLDKLEPVVQETRLYDENLDETRSMRSKEEANDYRYFPEPDIPPLVIDESYIARVAEELPELPWDRAIRYQDSFGLNEIDAEVIAAQRWLADYFDAVLAHDLKEHAVKVAHWLIGPLLALFNKSDLNEPPVSTEEFAKLLQAVIREEVSQSAAKVVLETMWQQASPFESTLDQLNLRQISDADALAEMVRQVLADNPSQLAAYREGKTKLFGFFVGQVMKTSQGRANPNLLNEVLKKWLAES